MQTAEDMRKPPMPDPPSSGPLRQSPGRPLPWALGLLLPAICTVGLNVEIASLLQGRPALPWPWKGTEIVLILALSLALLFFGVYASLRQQQNKGQWEQLENDRTDALSQAQRQYTQLLAISSMNQVLASKSTPQDVFDSLTEICARTFPCHQVSIMILDPVTQELEVRAAIGHQNLAQVKGQRRKLGEGVAGWVAQNKKPLILGQNVSAAEFKDFQPRAGEATSAMVAPILVRDELMGVINVTHRGPDVEFTDHDLRALLVFSWSAAVVIRHAEQAEWMRQTIRQLQFELEARSTAA